jgi:hypothetical protein
MNSNYTQQPVKDACPSWAVDQIKALYLLEVSQGNIPSSPEWRSNFVDEVHGRVFGGASENQDSRTTEILFDRIVRGLAADKISAEDTMAFINSRVGYVGGPKYCNLEEVRAALKG